MWLLILSCCRLYSYPSELILKQDKLVEKIEFGEINWTDGKLIIMDTEKMTPVIKDKGSLAYQEEQESYASDLAQARKMTRQKAQDKATRYLMDAVLNLRIRNDLLVRDYLLNTTNDFKFLLNDCVARNIKKEYIYNQDDTISARLTLPFFGSQGLLTVFTNDLTPPLVSFYSIFDFNTLMKHLDTMTNEPAQEFTSLIIDASDLKGIKPCLFPAVYDQDMKALYTSTMFPKSMILQRPFITYMPRITLIKDLPFIDNKSYIIKAVSVYGGTDLILPPEAVSRLFSDKKTITHLQEGNTAIIIKP